MEVGGTVTLYAPKVTATAKKNYSHKENNILTCLLKTI